MDASAGALSEPALCGFVCVCVQKVPDGCGGLGLRGAAWGLGHPMPGCAPMQSVEFNIKDHKLHRANKVRQAAVRIGSLQLSGGPAPTMQSRPTAPPGHRKTLQNTPLHAPPGPGAA